MKKELFPEWVLKYKIPGHEIRANHKGFSLYKISSYRVPGCKYPKKKQEYIGMLDPINGLVQKKLKVSNSYIEFGLSHIIYINFKGDLEDSIFNSAKEFKDIPIRLGILKFIFNSSEELFYNYSYISSNIVSELTLKHKTISDRRIEIISNKIKQLFIVAIPDKSERNYIIERLKLCVIDTRIKEFNKDNWCPDDLKIRLESKGFRV